MDELKFKPSLLTGLFRWITTSYGIKNGEVYIERSFMGFKFGKRPRLPVSAISRKNTQGNSLIGDIVFGEGSHDPVVWCGLLWPEKKFKTLENYLDGGVRSSVKRKSNFSYEMAKKTKITSLGDHGADQHLLALPRLRYKLYCGTLIDNRDGTVSHVEKGVMCVRAPWGMVWDNGKFYGFPHKLDWYEATRLFGEGGVAAYPLYFNDLSRLENCIRKRGACRVEFAGYDDWRLVDAISFYAFFNPLFSTNDLDFGVDRYDPDHFEFIKRKEMEVQPFVWNKSPDVYFESSLHKSVYKTPGLPKSMESLFPELSGRSLGFWLSDHAVECAWAFLGDSDKSFVDVKKKEKLEILFVRKANGSEYPGRAIVDVKEYEVPPELRSFVNEP